MKSYQRDHVGLTARYYRYLAAFYSSRAVLTNRMYFFHVTGIVLNKEISLVNQTCVVRQAIYSSRYQTAGFSNNIATPEFKSHVRTWHVTTLPV
jgi:hypothetical protein